jgi:hypothetical protein
MPMTAQQWPSSRATGVHLPKVGWLTKDSLSGTITLSTNNQIAFVGVVSHVTPSICLNDLLPFVIVAHFSQSFSVLVL